MRYRLATSIAAFVLMGAGSSACGDAEPTGGQLDASASVTTTTQRVDVPTTTEVETTVAPETVAPEPPTTPATTPPTQPPPPPTDPPAPPPTDPPALPDNGCHPSYDPCVPIASDADCAGGSGNGPVYTGPVRVIGPDEYDLDRDGDGYGCE